MTFTDFLRLPRWLERAWQETRPDTSDTVTPPVEAHELETLPLPLLGALVRRE